jgi:hypothetical protein
LYEVEGLLEGNKMPLTDIYGTTRPTDGTIDVGAVEAQ